MKEFKIGDMVYLAYPRFGYPEGPRMVVEKIHPVTPFNNSSSPRIECIWFVHGCKQFASFHPDTLVHYGEYS